MRSGFTAPITLKQKKFQHVNKKAAHLYLYQAIKIFSVSVRWSIYIINSVDKPNFRVSLPHRRSTTVSLEINPLYQNG